MGTMIKERKSRPKPPKIVEPRFLCVENTTPEIISVRNPDPTMNGNKDLTIQGYASLVIDEHWMDVPWFVSMVNSGSFKLFRSDAPPIPRDLSVPAKFRLNEALLEAQAIQVVTNPEYTTMSKNLIRVEPKNQRDMVDKEWLRSTGVQLLKNIEYREKHWRNRPELLRDVEARLAEIKDI